MLGPYLVDYSPSKIPHRLGPFDDAGIPMFDLKHLRMRGAPVYHPTVVIQHGLAAHTSWLRGGEAAMRATLLRCADWLVSAASLEPAGRFSIWWYAFPLRTPRMRGPFASGMGQGQGISLLLRAHEIDARPDYIATAATAASSLSYSLDDGGMLTELPSGAAFVQEIAHAPALSVLNGCLYALIGLDEYTRTFPTDRLLKERARIAAGVDELLPWFDLGWWSRYCLRLRWSLASPHYHALHIRQLEYLAQQFGRPAWQEQADAWRRASSTRVWRTRQRACDVVQRQIVRLATALHIDRVKYRSLPF